MNEYARNAFVHHAGSYPRDYIVYTHAPLLLLLLINEAIATSPVDRRKVYFKRERDELDKMMLSR